jgi:hypothetical protein
MVSKSFFSLDTRCNGRSIVEVKKSDEPNAFHAVPTPPKSTTLVCQVLVAEGGELLLGLAVHLGRLLGLRHLPPGRLLALVVCRALDLPALLETVLYVSLFLTLNP